LISKGVAIALELEALSQGENVETVECVEWNVYFSNIAALDVAFVKGASCVMMGEFSGTGPLDIVTVLGLHVAGKLLFPEGNRAHL